MEKKISTQSGWKILYLWIQGYYELLYILTDTNFLSALMKLTLLTRVYLLSVEFTEDNHCDL